MTGGELLLGQSLFGWLSTYGYFIFPALLIFFGPIAGFTAGMFASLGIFNPFLLFAIWIVTTTTIDSLLFFLGKFGRSILGRSKRARRILYKLQIAEQSETTTWIGVFKRHFIKIFFFLKISPTVSISDGVAIVAGALNIKFARLWIGSFLGQIIWSGVFLSLGYYFGGAIQDINFLINTTGIVLSLGFIVVFIYIKFVHKYLMLKLSSIIGAIRDLFAKNNDGEHKIL